MNDSYAGHNVVGLNVARDVEFGIEATGVANDAAPYPALMSVIEEGDGTAKAAFLYSDVKNPNSGQIDPERMDQDRIMGVALTSLYKNVVTLGADWRHFGDPESIIRSSFDFIESNGGLVIPVELLDFTAEQNANRVDLNWSTASETNSSLFEVEKAVVTDGIRGSFAKIDEVTAAGNSAVTSYYNTSDRSIESGATYSYRLKMVDMDGEFEYSGERVLTIDADGAISLDGVTPNPVVSQSVLRYTLGTSADVKVELYDVSGKLVMTLANSYQSSGTYELNINAGDLTSGVYKAVLQANGKTLSTNVNIVK
jgi:hypothetical protein